MPAARHRPRSVPKRARGEGDDRDPSLRAAKLPDRRGRLVAVHDRHLTVHEHEVVAARPAPPPPPRPRWPRCRRRQRSFCRIRALTSWLTGLSSATRMRQGSRRRLRQRPAARRPRAGATTARAGDTATVNQNVLPIPGLLDDAHLAAHQLRPADGRWQVPGRCRRCDWSWSTSTRENDSNSCCWPSGEMPIPVSCTSTRSRNRPSWRGVAVTDDRHPARRGVLHRVAQVVDQDLADAAGVARERLRDVGADGAVHGAGPWRRRPRPPDRRRSGPAAAGRSRCSRCRAVRLRSWRSPGCR